MTRLTAVVVLLLAGLTATASADPDDDTAYQAYRDDVEANLGGLSFLRILDEKLPLENDLGKDVERALALGPFAERCAGYAKLAPRGNRNARTALGILQYDPGQTCRLATQRMEIMKREVPKILAFRRKYARNAATRSLELIAKGEPITGAALACARDLECDGQTESTSGIEQQLGLSSAASDGDSAAFAAAIKRATSKRRIGTLHDRKREGLVKELLARQGLVPVATGLYAATDDIKKDGDVPLAKYRGVSVLVRVDGEPFCRSYMAYASADYLGNGRYGDLYAEGFDLEDGSFIVSSCK